MGQANYISGDVSGSSGTSDASKDERLTVLLSGKGVVTEYLFHLLSMEFPASVWIKRKRGWFHLERRHQLRIPEISQYDLARLQARIAVVTGYAVTIQVLTV